MTSCAVASLPQVRLEETEMIPKSGKSAADSRRGVAIQEWAALARSSLNGNQHVRLNPPPPVEILKPPLSLSWSQVFLRRSETT